MLKLLDQFIDGVTIKFKNCKSRLVLAFKNIVVLCYVIICILMNYD